MDFVEVRASQVLGRNKSSDWVVAPDFMYTDEGGNRIADLVSRGGKFHAYWDGNKWSRNEWQLLASIDRQVKKLHKATEAEHDDAVVTQRSMRSHNSKETLEWNKYIKAVPTNSDIMFDTKIMFSEDTPKREDYSTYQLSYTPHKGSTANFDELLSVLYSDEEKNKILWFMGAALSNNMESIQKFMYLYGKKGTGKGTVIDIFKLLFEDYTGNISLSKLTSKTDQFATMEVRDVPLLIDSDSDISRLDNDTNLLKMTAHEPVLVNPKHVAPYDVTFLGLLITASNQPFRVRNVDAGITRRAVVVKPTNHKVTRTQYETNMNGIKFELGAIADKAIKHFKAEGKYRYDNYVDAAMIAETNPMFSFMQQYYQQLGDPCTLKSASLLYEAFLEDLGFDKPRGWKKILHTELRRYYTDERDQIRMDGLNQRNVFSGLMLEVLFPDGVPEEAIMPKLVLDKTESPFDKYAADYPAQYANSKGFPENKWNDVSTVLSDLDTGSLHYINVPSNLIVIDFDIRNDNGEKDMDANLTKSAEFPPTYAEISKSGGGVHLHYLYTGDPTKLASIYEDNVEVKVYGGNQSLRRKLTKCNDLEVAEISEGLPLKEEKKKMLSDVSEMVWTQDKIKKSIKKALRREIHKNTKPSIDYINHVFEEAEASGVEYDLRDMRQDISVFAAQSTNQALECIKIANHINYSTVEETKPEGGVTNGLVIPDDELYIFDLEVYPNLLIIAWKKHGMKDKTIWYNPSKAQVEWLLSKPLIGFNCKRYDNHICYGAITGESNIELFHRSRDLVSNDNGFAGQNRAAKEFSYADIYEYASKRQSLKKWEIELGIKHDEFEFPWDQPLAKENWSRAGEYCGNDVDATDATFDATYEDYVALKILSELSGLPVGSSIQDHAAHIIFKDAYAENVDPRSEFPKTDLSQEFPGYTYEKVQNKKGDFKTKSDYDGIDPSEGGYIFSKPGVYHNVAEIDIESQHPNSLIQLNYFGKYTKRFEDLVQLRLYIKHGNLIEARKMFDGQFEEYLNDKSKAKALAQALKIIINKVYGMTSASWDNVFKAYDNNDNVVAKRGALFQIAAKRYAESKGYKVIHIKTDSMKLANATDEMIADMIEFSHGYGYNYDLENKFSIFALLDKANLIGLVEDDPKWGSESCQWHAIGAIFKQPYVYKSLFSGEDLVPKDYAFAKQVRDPWGIYLEDTYIGKIGEFYASKSGFEMTKRKTEDDETINSQAVSGTKGVNWRLFSDLKDLSDLDMSYYESLCIATVEKIVNASGDFAATDDLLTDVPSRYKEHLPFAEV